MEPLILFKFSLYFLQFILISTKSLNSNIYPYSVLTNPDDSESYLSELLASNETTGFNLESTDSIEDQNHFNLTDRVDDSTISDMYYAFQPKGTNQKMVIKCDKTLAIIDSTESSDISLCNIFDMEKNPEDAYALVKFLNLPIQYTDFKTMMKIIDSCTALDQQPSNSLPNDLNEEVNNTLSSNEMLLTFWRGILPGTKYCGMGDIAKQYSDLGLKRDIDICCRAHDFCPYRLKAFRSGYDLVNMSFYTKSHCDCDENFLRCLKRVNTSLSATLGNLFFNVIRVQCFRQEYPRICKQYKKTHTGVDECIDYEVNPKLAKWKFTHPEAPY